MLLLRRVGINGSVVGWRDSSHTIVLAIKDCVRISNPVIKVLNHFELALGILTPVPSSVIVFKLRSIFFMTDSSLCTRVLECRFSIRPILVKFILTASAIALEVVSIVGVC